MTANKRSRPFAPGDRVLDREGDLPRDAAVVDGLPGTNADEHAIPALGQTVADLNSDYPADDPVVEVRFNPNSGTSYSYPAGRLERIPDDWEPAECGASQSTARYERDCHREDHPEAFDAFEAALRAFLGESDIDPSGIARALRDECRRRSTPETYAECRFTREDDYRPADEYALVCWECNGGGRRPRKLDARDNPGPSTPCKSDDPQAVHDALDWWIPAHLDVSRDVVSPSTTYSPWSFEGDLGSLTKTYDRRRRLAAVRLAWKATLEGILDEDYNYQRAVAFLRDRGVNTDALLPGGESA